MYRICVPGIDVFLGVGSNRGEWVVQLFVFGMFKCYVSMPWNWNLWLGPWLWIPGFGCLQSLHDIDLIESDQHILFWIELYIYIYIYSGYASVRISLFLKSETCLWKLFVNNLNSWSSSYLACQLEYTLGFNTEMMFLARKRNMIHCKWSHTLLQAWKPWWAR